jgi:hypothetical protein
VEQWATPTSDERVDKGRVQSVVCRGGKTCVSGECKCMNYNQPLVPPPTNWKGLFHIPDEVRSSSERTGRALLLWNSTSFPGNSPGTAMGTRDQHVCTVDYRPLLPSSNCSQAAVRFTSLARPLHSGTGGSDGECWSLGVAPG